MYTDWALVTVASGVSAFLFYITFTDATLTVSVAGTYLTTARRDARVITGLAIACATRPAWSAHTLSTSTSTLVRSCTQEAVVSVT